MYHFGTITKCVDYAGVLIFKCPDYQVYCIILLFVLMNGQPISNPYFKRVDVPGRIIIMIKPMAVV